MIDLLNVCRFTAGSSGADDFSDGDAVTGFRNLEDAGAIDGYRYPYRAESETRTEWEIGYGTALDTSGGWVLERTTIIDSSSGGTKVAFTNPPVVLITPLALDLKQPAISPALFGAVVGTSADQTSAISATFDAAAAAGAKVYFPAGTWRQDAPISKSYALDIELHPDAVIDCRELANSEFAWSFSGSYGTAYSITATGASSVTVSTGDAANFSFGEYVIVRSDDVFDASRTNSKIGEINRVQSVDVGTGVITLSVPLQESYTTNPVIERPTFIRDGWVRGGQFLSEDGLDNLNSAKAAIRYTLGIKCFVEDASFTRFDDRAILFVDSVDCHADDNSIRRARSSGTAYAISFQDCCQDCGARGNFSEDVRHALSTNNSASRGGIPRRITFAENHVFISAAAVSPGSGGGDAIDTHAAARDVKIIDNTVIGSTGQGINVEAPSCEVVGNTIISSASNGIAIHNESDKAGSAIVCRNVVRNSGTRGLYLFNGSAGTSAEYTSAVIAENIIDGAGLSSTVAGLQVNPSTSNPVAGLVLKGNRIRASSGRGVDVNNVENAAIVANSVAGPGSTQAMSVRNAVNCTISGNVVTQPNSSSSAVFQITAASSGTSIGNSVNGNRFGAEPGGSVTGNGVTLDNNVQYTGVHANNVRNTNGISLGSGTGNAQANNIT